MKRATAQAILDDARRSALGQAEAAAERLRKIADEIEGAVERGDYASAVNHLLWGVANGGFGLLVGTAAQIRYHEGLLDARERLEGGGESLYRISIDVRHYPPEALDELRERIREGIRGFARPIEDGVEEQEAYFVFDVGYGTERDEREYREEIVSFVRGEVGIGYTIEPLNREEQS